MNKTDRSRAVPPRLGGGRWPPSEALSFYAYAIRQSESTKTFSFVGRMESSASTEAEGPNLLFFCISKLTGRIGLDAKNVPTRNSLGRCTFGCIEERRVLVPTTHVHEVISPGSFAVAVQRRKALA